MSINVTFCLGSIFILGYTALWFHYSLMNLHVSFASMLCGVYGHPVWALLGLNQFIPLFLNRKRKTDSSISIDCLVFLVKHPDWKIASPLTPNERTCRPSAVQLTLAAARRRRSLLRNLKGVVDS